MTTGRINQVAFLADKPAPAWPEAKTSTAVARTKRRTRNLSRQRGGPSAPRAHRVFRIRENGHRPRAGLPHDARGRTRGAGTRTGPRGPPRDASPRGAPLGGSNTYWDDANCLRDGYATQETDVGRVDTRRGPLDTEEAVEARRRCPSRDPTHPRKPTTTHAPSRTQCPTVRPPGPAPRRPGASRRTSTEGTHRRDSPDRRGNEPTATTESPPTPPGPESGRRCPLPRGSRPPRPRTNAATPLTARLPARLGALATRPRIGHAPPKRPPDAPTGAPGRPGGARH